MEKYWEVFVKGYTDYSGYLWREITFQSSPWWQNYFFWLVMVSAFFLMLEWVKPWREDQARFRKDFWLDFFYMFFNFFLFNLIIYIAGSNVVVELFNQFLENQLGITNLVAIEIGSWPVWTQLLTLFLVRDFVQWNTHRLLHAVPFLWEFHKVHHSVEQMGFAAHLRYHWMETIVYRSLEYLPLAMIGFGIEDFFIVYVFTLAVGHFNHSNIRVPLGPLKYIFNNPQMHIWHHAHDLPEGHPRGINFGITLSVWDYIFGSAVIPHNGRDIKLGFPGVENFPDTFWKQLVYGFRIRSRNGKRKTSNNQ